MSRLKLTKRVVESYTPDSAKRTLLWDTEVTGFCIRIYPTGKKTYFLQYRNAFRETKFLKIGVHGNITTEQAREKAVVLALKVNNGEDPSVAAAPTKITLPTMQDLADKYMKLHAENEKRPKSITEDKRMLKNYVLKEFGSRKVEDMTFEDIQKLHVSLNKKKVLSNRILALLHKMFNLSVQWKWRTDNPASGIKKYQEIKRTRWLQEEELKRLLDVLDKHHNIKIANIIRLLLLTGARKHEILSATWDQLDLERGIWTKMAHTTKQKKMEHTPLSPASLVILKSLYAEKENSPFLFPGPVEGKPIQDIKKSWATICKKANLEDFHLHDLRHTYASHLVSSGLSLSIVGKLLGHTQAATTQRYAHLADSALREATTLFSDKFMSLGNG
jgi:integrase